MKIFFLSTEAAGGDRQQEVGSATPFQHYMLLSVVKK